MMKDVAMTPNPDRKLFWFVFSCFFLSGMTGLIYQVLWTKMIVRIIGAAPFAISIILTVFMAGLGLGSYLASRWIDSIKESGKLVRLYGLLELIVAIYAILIPELTTATKPLYSIAYNQLQGHFLAFNIVTFVGCFFLLVLPVICMGATLPILCRFYVRHLSQLGTYTGRLYGINTIGAAFGALVSGFWLIQWLGVMHTLYVAVAVNALIGITCIVLGGRGREDNSQETIATEDSTVAQSASITDADFGGARTAALVIFGIQGFCAMAYEVIWTKLLGLIVGPTTFSFTIVLVTFILGLALGSIFFGWLADKTGKPFRLLVMTQVAAAFFALAASQYFGNSQLFYAKLLSRFQDSFFMLSTMKALTLFAVMVWPTLFLGATFPLVSKIYTQSVSRVGHSIGYAYMINTVGAVLGSFCAGFLLIPFLGKEHSLSLVIAIQFASAGMALLIALMAIKEKRWRLAWIAAPMVLGIVLCWSWPAWNPRLLATGRYHRFNLIQLNLNKLSWWDAAVNGAGMLAKTDLPDLIHYSDGIGGFVTVQGFTDIVGQHEQWMTISGKPDTSTTKDVQTNTLMANFPLLFSSNVKDVMVLGLASGITAGELLNYPINKVDVLEISPEVVKASNYFRKWNYDALDSPKLNMIVQDARAHLEHTNRRYDAIISVPSNAWMAGLAALFTADFYNQVKSKLNDDGIFVQFIYTYQIDWANFAMIGRTFAQAFPNSMLVSTDPSTYGADYLMVGFKSPTGHLNLEAARQNMQYVAKSRNVRLAYPELLYRMIVSEDLPSLFGPGPLNSDDRPQLEFAAPKMMFKNEQEILMTMHQKQVLRPETTAIVQKLISEPNSRIDFADYAMSVHNAFPGMVDLSKLNQEQKERYLRMVAEYASMNEIEDLTADDGTFTGGLEHLCRQVQIAIIEKTLDSQRDKAKALTYRADLLTAEGQLDEAIAGYKEAIAIDPHRVEAVMDLGVAYYKRKDIDLAISQFEEALKLKPDYSVPHTYLGHLLKSQGRLAESDMHFKAARELSGD
jgi:spermidine synthase